ncbi:activating signal cointegrator 1 complex subunit 2-like, partial [Copidosoma floridanum]|uniref:activating signal cointegrator 1 complex subunit 2-like n=1 Tax=Copidosoma floridanum TaxID=29053 RepID=UPI0006C9A235
MVENKSIIQMTPVLDEYWICERLFLKYEAPILVDSQGKYITGAKERWLELVRYIYEDVTWLLLQPSCRFWSCVIYNSSIIDSIVIFLQEAPTPYTLKNFPDDNDIKEHFDKLRKSILLVLARFMSNQETALNYIDSVKHAYLLYNKYILTVPILMDICQQYGQDNRKIIEKIVNEAFTIQPLYEKDLE